MAKLAIIILFSVLLAVVAANQIVQINVEENEIFAQGAQGHHGQEHKGVEHHRGHHESKVRHEREQRARHERELKSKKEREERLKNAREMKAHHDRQIRAERELRKAEAVQRVLVKVVRQLEVKVSTLARETQRVNYAEAVALSKIQKREQLLEKIVRNIYVRLYKLEHPKNGSAVVPNKNITKMFEIELPKLFPHLNISIPKLNLTIPKLNITLPKFPKFNHTFPKFPKFNHTFPKFPRFNGTFPKFPKLNHTKIHPRWNHTFPKFSVPKFNITLPKFSLPNLNNITFPKLNITLPKLNLTFPKIGQLVAEADEI